MKSGQFRIYALKGSAVSTVVVLGTLSSCKPEVNFPEGGTPGERQTHLNPGSADHKITVAIDKTAQNNHIGGPFSPDCTREQTNVFG